MESEALKLNGKITYILFRNDDTFYTVAKFKINDLHEKSITITGIMPDVQTNILYNIYGNYVEHPRFGMQFKVETYDIPLPDEEEGIIRYLSGIQFAGVGKKTAEKVVHALGEDCLNMIRNDSSVLYTVPGLSEKHIQSIIDGLSRDDNGMDELVRFLNVNGIGMRNLTRLNRTYGLEAMSKIRENPYRVIEECDGFGFVTADKIAMSLGIERDDPRRLYAYLVSLANDYVFSSGNTYIMRDALTGLFCVKTGADQDTAELMLHDALVRRSLVNEEDRIYPAVQFDAERQIARYFAGFPYAETEPCDDALLERYLESFQNDIGISYGEKQKEAINTLFHEDVMIMTGGPGTGKTTVVRAMVSLFKMLYPSSEVVCVAPTGRAAKRLSELTESKAATIHSLLQWDLESNTFGKNEDEPVFADLLIIDEFSMVDSWLFSNLLKAGKNIRKICIIGDEDQLPSVGPGSVLRDLIESELFPLIRLNHIYRQTDGSDVIRLARDINTGEVDLEDYKADAVFFNCDTVRIKDNITHIVTAALEKGYGINDIQVLSAMYDGVAGINMMNNTLQEFLNPHDIDKAEIKNGYMTFREGDKILQLKNQPDDDVYNGDIGILEEIIPASESESRKPEIVVDFQGNYVYYTQENWSNITLAYCISVHKSQGSEYPIVIMPFTSQMHYMLQRRLIYTAVTRARKALIMLGERSAFLNGIRTLDRNPRMTTLKERLLQLFDEQM